MGAQRSKSCALREINLRLRFATEKNLKLLADTDLALRLAERIASVLAEPEDLPSIPGLAQLRWSVLPREDAISDSQASSFVEALRSSGATHFLAARLGDPVVSVTKRPHVFAVYEFALNPSELLEMTNDHIPMAQHRVVTSNRMDLMLLLRFDYWFFVGQPDLVTRAVGGDLLAAREWFHRWAYESDEFENRRLQQLDAIYNCSKLDPHA